MAACNKLSLALSSLQKWRNSANRMALQITG
jgi:hypothetical protein